MGRFGFGTRLAMVVLGAIWCVGGWVWLQILGPFDQRTPGRRIHIVAAMIVLGGLILIKSGLTPDRPKSFEEMEGDLNPNLDNDNWDAFDD